jgi:3-hydroxyisobutyrate dehydrogenase-like beta-hydroxyacid dehydrogenase
MAKTNYTFEKRQKEIAKKQKKEAKLLKKSTTPDEQAGSISDDHASLTLALVDNPVV